MNGHSVHDSRHSIHIPGDECRVTTESTGSAMCQNPRHWDGLIPTPFGPGKNTVLGVLISGVNLNLPRVEQEVPIRRYKEYSIPTVDRKDSISQYGMIWTL